jgi:hypothetical protein
VGTISIPPLPSSPAPAKKSRFWRPTVGFVVLLGFIAVLLSVLTYLVKTPSASSGGSSPPNPPLASHAEPGVRDADIVLHAITAARSALGIGDWVMNVWQGLLDVAGGNPRGLVLVAESPVVRKHLDSLRSEVIPFEKPRSIPDADLLALHVACQQYADSVASMRGTWPDYKRETTDLRIRLDAAIITVEARLAAPQQIAAAKAAADARVQDFARRFKED